MSTYFLRFSNNQRLHEKSDEKWKYTTSIWWTKHWCKLRSLHGEMTALWKRRECSRLQELRKSLFLVLPYKRSLRHNGPRYCCYGKSTKLVGSRLNLSRIQWKWVAMLARYVKRVLFPCTAIHLVRNLVLRETSLKKAQRPVFALLRPLLFVYLCVCHNEDPAWTQKRTLQGK